MSIPLGNDSITIVRAPLVEDETDGTEYRDWANAEETVVTGVKVNPFELAEKLAHEISTGPREWSRTGLKVYAPAGVTILYTDRILYGDFTLEVWGHPLTWTDFEGNPSHTELICQIKEG